MGVLIATEAFSLRMEISLPSSTGTTTGTRRSSNCSSSSCIRNKLQWAFCEAEWVDAGTTASVKVSSAPVQDGDILEALILNNFIVASTAVVAKSVFEEVGYFNEAPDVAAVEDWDLWLRIAARFPVGCVRKKLCVLRLHADSFLAALPTAARVAHMEGVIERAVDRDPSRLGRTSEQGAGERILCGRRAVLPRSCASVKRGSFSWQR